MFRFLRYFRRALVAKGVSAAVVTRNVRNYDGVSRPRCHSARRWSLGNTFLLDRNNPLSCIGGGDDQGDATDERQWVAAFGDGIAYSTVRNLNVAVGSGNLHTSKITDAGRTWTSRISATP